MNLLLCKIKPLFASVLILLSFFFLILGLAYLNYYVFGNVNLKTTDEPGHRFICGCNVLDEQNNISGKIFCLIKEADGFICIFFTLASDSATVYEFDGLNPPKSKGQCDGKCGFFASRDVSKITTSDGSTCTYVLRGVLIPFVGILGLVGNILSIKIFNRPEMKIWNFNGGYEMTNTSFIIISKKYIIKEKRQTNPISIFNKKSQAGVCYNPVIQANGRLKFEDDLRYGGLLYCVHTEIRCQSNSNLGCWIHTAGQRALGEH